MASQNEIERLYDWLDNFQHHRLGDCADISCAYFDGDFSKTLEQAQTDKHNWVLDTLGCKEGSWILDVGSGWGPILKAVSDRGGVAVGLNLSSAQTRYCLDRGLDARLLDWKRADTDALGMFDGIVCIGAFEHFCSLDEYVAGKQMDIYRDFFGFCANLLPAGAILFLQTMTWGDAVPDPATCTRDAPEGSAERILFRLRSFYPGSWLPSGKTQILEAASPYFKLVGSSNGRKDYIETGKRWGQATKSIWKPDKILKTLASLLPLVPRYVVSSEFRTQIESIRSGDQQRCFEQSIMDHERLFLGRTDDS
jgi:cyclopropane-fatty-acyl-phospholipid synthase